LGFSRKKKFPKKLQTESYNSFSASRFDAEGASSLANLSPWPIAAHFNFPLAQVMLPVIGGKGIIVWDHKHDLDLSGTLSLPSTLIAFFVF